MLKSENRLKKDTEFRRIFRSVRPVCTTNLAVRVQESRTNVTRFGFVIGIKVEKLAVRRNALRRLFHRAAREFLPLIKTSLNIVVVVKQPFPYPYGPNEIKRQLEEGLRKAGVLKQ
ncbi:MAG: ribonuclease P protein component [Patescibacteria group bacterium]